MAEGRSIGHTTQHLRNANLGCIGHGGNRTKSLHREVARSQCLLELTLNR